MPRLTFSVIVLVLVAVGCQQAAAQRNTLPGWEEGEPVVLGDKHPASALFQPHLEKLANRPTRVHGVCVDKNADFPDPILGFTGAGDFYYSGNVKQLNEFLRDFTLLKSQPLSKDVPLRVILHPGRAAPVAGKSYDWRMCWDMGWGELEAGKNLVARYVVTGIHVWLGGNVKLDELKVPAAIEVSSGGEIESFIKKHKRVRSNAGYQPLNGPKLPLPGQFKRQTERHH